MTTHRVILIEPAGSRNFNPNSALRGNSAPPYAIECLGGYLQAVGGFDVGLIHQRPVTVAGLSGAAAEISNEDIAAMVALDQSCFLVGISAYTPLFNKALEISKKIKQRRPEMTTVIGGYHASLLREKIYLSNRYNGAEEELRSSLGDPKLALVDFFVVGEGERTLLALAERVKGGRGDFEDIPGIIFRKEGSLNRFTARQRMDGPELDVLGTAYRKILVPVRNGGGEIVDVAEVPSSLDCTQFGTFPPPDRIRGELQVATSRGCPGRCEFCCSDDVWGRRITYRDPESVVDEIVKYHRDPDYRTNYVYFADLTFNEKLEHVHKLCASMNRAGVFGTDDPTRVHWSCLIKPFAANRHRSGRAREILAEMREAGCSKVVVGVEAFDAQDIVELKRPCTSGIRKDRLQEGIEKYTNAVMTLKTASDLGIITRGCFVWGRANQQSESEARARELLDLEVPSSTLADYDAARSLVAFVLGADRGPNVDGGQLAAAVEQRFGGVSQAKEKFLSIDHIRVAPETPYYGTALASEAALRYRNESGVVVKTDLLGRSVEAGWDDWEVLDQEAPVLDSDLPIEEIEASQKRLIAGFYGSGAYARRLREKARRHPHLAEAYASWVQFLRERGIGTEEEVADEFVG